MDCTLELACYRGQQSHCEGQLHLEVHAQYASQQKSVFLTSLQLDLRQGDVISLQTMVYSIPSGSHCCIIYWIAATWRTSAIAQCSVFFFIVLQNT